MIDEPTQTLILFFFFFSLDIHFFFDIPSPFTTWVIMALHHFLYFVVLSNVYPLTQSLSLSSCSTMHLHVPVCYATMKTTQIQDLILICCVFILFKHIFVMNSASRFLNYVFNVTISHFFYKKF